MWWRDAELLAEAAQDMLVGHKRRLKRMCAQDLGCVLWAFAMLQWEDEDLFGALAQAVREQFATLKPLDIGNVAWALAIAKQMDSHTARMIADHALRQPGDSFGHDFGSTAEGWVHVLSGLEEPLSTAGDREKWEALKARFSLAIFAPLCDLAAFGFNPELYPECSDCRQRLMYLPGEPEPYKFLLCGMAWRIARREASAATTGHGRRGRCLDAQKPMARGGIRR